LLGGRVEQDPRREYRTAQVVINVAEAVLRGADPVEKAWTSHSDTVLALPESFETLPHSVDCPIAAFRHRERPIFGV